MSNQLKQTVIITVIVFVTIWFVVFYHHERHHQLFPHLNQQNAKILPSNNALKGKKQLTNEEFRKILKEKQKNDAHKDHTINFQPDIEDVNKQNEQEIQKIINQAKNPTGKQPPKSVKPIRIKSENVKLNHEEQEKEDLKDLIVVSPNITKDYSLADAGADNKPQQTHYRYNARRGMLVCNGERIDSEIIYWKIIPSDLDYESPITPHHHEHHDRYLTFEYDHGGWNNVRMGLESLIVVAHATGRTLVTPPQQHLYLLGATHKDPHDKVAHDEMGFEDFFDLNLLKGHRGFHLLSMEEFLEKEGVTGGLRGILPPQNSSKVWGQALWNYLNKVADIKPTWWGRFIAFPKHSGDFNLSEVTQNQTVKDRLKRFGGDRSPVFYDQELQKAHHIHFPGGESHRVLQHHYAFTFFADETMQKFYRRFVRDFMRYKDPIQCAGAELVGAVRADSRKSGAGGDYYALHIRRGDFQYKDVKLSAEEIYNNLHFKNGTPIIPQGSLVYVSTDDPDGVCKDCFVQRKPCTSYTPGSKPPGCPEDPSWNAFVTKGGWKIRFLRDYIKAGYLHHVNPNVHGMVESIVCSRAKVFAGTYFSTFTGYIHRLRGYHGLGEATYYHSKDRVFAPQMSKSVGHGFSREWRAGWTDDGGELI